MKKLMALLAAFIVTASSVYALEIPVICGFGATADFSGTDIKGNLRDYLQGTEANIYYNILSGGFFVFYDFYFAEASLGFSGLFNFVAGNKYATQASQGTDASDVTLGGTSVNLALLGKFPFEFDGFSVYPLLGIEGRFCVAMNYLSKGEYEGEYIGGDYQGNPADWNTFWFRGGAGADFFITSEFFIRTTFTAGIKLNTARENTIQDRIKTDKTYFFDNCAVFGAGAKLTIALGYNFGSTSFSLPSFGGGGGHRRSSGSRTNIYLPR